MSPFSLSPAQRTLRARIAAHTLHSQRDPRETTRAGRDAARVSLDARLLDEVDPQRTLAEPERARRLAHARRAHFLRLALQSARARGRKGGPDA